MKASHYAGYMILNFILVESNQSYKENNYGSQKLSPIFFLRITFFQIYFSLKKKLQNFSFCHEEIQILL